MAPEGQKPSQWLCLTKLPRDMYSQPIVHKALSWGAIGFAPKVVFALKVGILHQKSFLISLIIFVVLISVVTAQTCIQIF